MVGADTRKERKPNRRLVRRTWRSSDEEERNVMADNITFECAFAVFYVFVTTFRR